MQRGDGPDQTRRFPGPDAPGRSDETRRVDGLVGSPRRDGSGPTRRMGAPAGAEPTRHLGGPNTPEGPVLDGRYRLTGLLGTGGMADVRRAVDLQLNRPVAVKIFRPGTDPDGEQRFREEARTLANLNHPGLIPVHDFGIEQHRAYLVMELVEGPTLRARLDREGLPLAEVARIGSDVANVLAYVHTQGVVHRDVTPSNVLLDQGRRVRLADFGISRLAGAAGLTSADLAVGTPAYMAPEQVQGDHAGPPADVYALGLVLLEAVTGRPEYPGGSWEAAAERLSRPPAVPGDLPEPLRRALLTMTETDPARRPTARQAAQMLADVATGEDSADSGYAEEPAGSTTKRYFAIAIGLVVLIAALVIASPVSAQDAPQTAQPSVPATTEDTGSGPAADNPTGAPTAEDPGPSGGGDSGPRFPSPPSINLSDLPDVPDLPNVPEVPESVREDARGLWERFTDWLSGVF
ncbi:serine/threonine-protein kinase [Pseudonocardia bannensis]|uniref:non-specific serine/threonine protein kinase n=1 Tax=Pseudonocardia bannensis TaxID=630973 RepID=A0A848DC71_9PSEU|nr:serine/threonine-protein kinase [Pseudonocardia bannensis]NMH90076.1 serine/threonine protein kinase [Pseudonocardia bannensis]